MIRLYGCANCGRRRRDGYPGTIHHCRQCKVSICGSCDRRRYRPCPGCTGERSYTIPVYQQV